MKSSLKNIRRAVTLTELLVVLAILSLLATIAVPVYVQKTEQARRATARFEVRSIAEAEQQVQVTHGFYVPMHLLDNLPNDDDLSGSSAIRDDFENYTNPGNVFFVNPFINLLTQDQPTLSEGLTGSDVQAGQMIAFWAGPFLNPTRVASDFENPQTSLNQSFDLVLDPWGRPYVFFSPIGIIADQNLSSLDDLRDYNITQTSTARIQIDNGELQDDRTSNYPFDRYAIVSYGANGILDAREYNTTVAEDDVFYTFGFTPNETAFNAF